MKENIKKAKLVTLLIIVGLAVAALDSMAKGPQGIRYTRHNLANWFTSADSIFHSTNVNEICVFCHTPHAAGGTPLWNKEIDTRNGVNINDSSHFIAYSTNYTAKPTKLGPETMLCMSCHDGVSSMKSVHNTPNTTSGSIEFNVAGDQLGAGGQQAIGDIGDAYEVSIELLGFFPASSDFYYNTSGLGMMFDVGNKYFAASANFATGDHPISINYATVLSNLPASKISEFHTLAEVQAKLPLFGSGKNMLECATCHDPHVNYYPAEGGNAAYKPFLTTSNISSAMCFACHIK